MPLKKALHVRENEKEEAYESEEAEREEGELEESGADKQLSMWFQSRAYPDPFNLNEKYDRAWQQAQAIRSRTANSRIQSANWIALGPSTTPGGRVLSIAINPVKTTSIYIGTASGGIWKSYTGGTGTKNWQKVITGFQTLGVSSIIINPSDTMTMYAGTGEVYRVDTSNIGFNVWKARGTYGVGILKSTDGGASWSRCLVRNTSQMFAVNMLKFDPTNSNTIYAACTDGLYKSTDAGANWTQILAKIYVSDVAINPANNQQIVVGVGNLVNADKGVYRSTNGGTTWAAKIATVPAAFSGYIRFDNSSNGARLYASVGGTTNELYMSTDFGATWIAKTGSAHCGGQYWFGHDLAVDPANQDRVIMGGVSYYTYTSTSTTTNAGTRGSITGPHADVHDIKFDPVTTTTCYIACDGGMWKSTNSGSTWTEINNGLNATQFYASLACSPTNPNILIGGLQDNGVMKFDGTSWTSLVGGDGGTCAFNPNGTTVLYCNDARAAYYSTNTGSTETQVLLNCGYGYSPAAYDDRTAFMSPMIIAPSNPNIVYIASDNLHYSSSAGSSFTRPNPGTDFTRPIELMYKTGIAMGISYSNPDKLYISTSPFSQKANPDALNVNPPPGVLRSLNATNNTGYVFTSIKGSGATALPDRFINDFAVSRTNDDSVFVAVGGFGTQHVYVTGNGGTTWAPVGAGLPDCPFNAVALDPTNPKILYAAGDLGVYVSPNRGATWYDFNTGFWDATQVMDIQFASDGQVVVATHGKGIFKSTPYTSILPVNIESFTGEVLPSSNKLEWRVSQELDVSRYELERGTSTNNFQTIASVPATNSAVYTHIDPVSNNASYYYRVKSVDIDGAYKYSEVVLLRRNGSNSLQVYGNPFSSSVDMRITSAQSGRGEISLFDAEGRLLRFERPSLSQGVNRYTLKDLGNLPAGTYFMDAIVSGQRFRQKLVKK